MKGKMIVVTVVTLLFVGFVIAKLIFDVMAKKEGRLRVVSNKDAVFFLDNVMKGKTPFENTLKEGTYMLKVIPEQTSSQSAVTWEKKITVSIDTLTYVDVRLENTDVGSSAEVYWLTPRGGFGSKPSGLIVESEPSGALVYMDNDEKGISPLTIDSISPGSHELTMFMPGFVRKTKKINVTQGSFLHAFMKLAADPDQVPKYSPVDQIVVATAAADLKQPTNTVRVLDTPTGWLRVRDEPSLAGSESARVNPGQVFEYISEDVGWYEIRIDKNHTGWISSQFAQKN